MITLLIISLAIIIATSFYADTQKKRFEVDTEILTRTIKNKI